MNFGPGIGTLIGQRMAEVDMRADGLASARGQLQATVRQRQRQIAMQKAATLAAAELLELIMNELRGGSPRKLSLPSARAERNRRFAALLSSHLYTVSKGQEVLMRDERERLVSQAPIK